MENFICYKCNSTNLYIDNRGNQKALMCKDCNSWIKWISKKDLPLVLEFINSKEEIDKGEISDGYHTFNELYYHRMVLFSVICNTYKDYAWKSLKHEDGTMYDDYFIVGINTPKGDYSYHYHKDYWNEFKVKELSHAPKWDGHKPCDVDRLISLLYIPCKTIKNNKVLKLKNLIACFESAKENGAKFVGIKIQMLDCNKAEIIINPRENFDSKLSYYKIAYDDYLQLKSVPDRIKITGFTYGDTFEDIQKNLID